MKNALMAKAKELFDETRAGELEADVEKTAAELMALHNFPLTIDDEI